MTHVNRGVLHGFIHELSMNYVMGCSIVDHGFHHG